MRAFLMYPDRDFDLERELPPNEPDLAADLELETLLQAMGGNDEFLLAVARHGLCSSLTDPGEIIYRQHVLADCIAQPAAVRELYELAVTAITAERRLLGWSLHDSPDSILSRARHLLSSYLEAFRQLRDFAGAQAASFRSEGFTRLFAMLGDELNEEYLAEVETEISELGFRHGTLISARLGPGAKGTGYVLRRQPEQTWRDRIPALNRSGHSFYVPERDLNGLRTLSDLTDRGVNTTANAVAQSADHIKAFFGMLQAELGFYLGCLNLRDQLSARGGAVCYPAPSGPAAAGGQARLASRGLYDTSLALRLETGRTVGNDLDADGKALVMITGANQGGKSTFLRSLGQAQLMMQAGMFVAADSFAASVVTGLFTHFKREEDTAMEKGKLDEELDRMSVIIDQVTPGALLLANESFASTNEREGSEIGREVIRALTEAGIRVVFVTHLYDLAGRLYGRHDPAMLFLRAERRDDGHRTFHLPPGQPLPTSYGEDLYQAVFGAADQTVPA